jgi:bifunctional non-homologous end joining protein LigD
MSVAANVEAPKSAKEIANEAMHEQEFVVGGYTLPPKGGSSIGALLLGYYDEQHRLIYAGRTGTGFTPKVGAVVRKRLESVETPSSPFHNPEADARKGAIWTRPSMVVQIRYAAWTTENQLRQATFLTIREDKPASEVRREPAPTS